MKKVLTQYLFLTTLFVHLNCKVYNDRPKIKSRNGHLILEPAQDKNIYFVTNGPKSSVYVGDINLLNLTTTTRIEGQFQPTQSDEFETFMNAPQGILHRLAALESQTTISSSDLIRNITLIWTRISRLTTKINNLQNRINNGRDECQSQTCQHGGTCLNLVNGYYCLCPSNWEGRNCEVDVNECRNFAGTDLGCQNGADCINRPGTYECRCRTGWYGLHCTRREKDCSGGNFEMCGHGSCVTSGDGIKCICDQGWTTNGTSAACLTDVNECDTSLGPRCSINPKVQCINLPGSFRCGQCPRGYEGDGYTCTDVDECLTINNGGCSPMVSCHNTIGSRICGPCPPGYIGDGITCSWRGSCSINRGGCHPSAQCIDNLALGGQLSQCVCPAGMDGDGIGLHGCYISNRNNSIQSCQGNPCGPNGQCHELRNGYTCLCFRGYTGAHCNSIADPCATKPCHNGGLCQPDDTTPMGYRCECTAQYTGLLCQVRARSCGGVLDSEEGSIIYPITNTSYEHNSKCAWIIHTASNKVINVTFSKFNLEFSSECQYDFLQIHDGRSSSDQLIGRFCGTEFPKGGHFVSSHNNLYFWFRSDTNVNKEGFALHWNSIDPVCGGEIDATIHGQISSPGSPGNYPPNRDCFWHLKTTYGKRILIHFFQLDIEVHENCSFDYLAIYDGEHSTDPLLNKYCSSVQPEPVQSAGSEMLIHFHSDSYGNGKGFQLTFAPMDGIPGCGGFYTADRGEIVSPSYDGMYLNNLVCEYKIKTSPEFKIQIEFKSFKLERSFRCMYDYLKVYDGPSTEARLFGKFCGDSKKSNIPKTFTSSKNNLFIKFKTDHTTSGEGFRITYKTICHHEVIGDSGIIKSPGYPFSYPENKVCVYVISTTPGKAIQLTFQDFDIEDTTQLNCMYDNIEVRDGPNINSTLMGRFCGGSGNIPPVQISTHNFMHLRFKSDMSFTGTGFYANFTTISTECGGIYKSTTGIVSHPSGENTKYKLSQSCTWLLVAPEGMHIKLSWHRFDIENTHFCESDYLELIEIDSDNKEETISKYCGATVPPALTTTTNRLKLKFVSDQSFTGEGFSLSYTFLDERSNCGGNYAKAHGIIYSPGWPNAYEPNRDCTWIINVPTGQQIKLNISQFDLERPIRNKCDLGDYLEIRNGASANSPLINKYCGTFQWKQIISMSNSIYLRFFSDYYLTGTGFKIEWDGTIQGCGGTLTTSKGSITSPNYPNNYHENSECFYRIVTSQGSRLKITFNELDLEFTRMCTDDHVEIFDGRDASAHSLGRYCKMTPGMASIETTTHFAFIKFRSDFFTNAKGFLLNYETICNNNVSGTYGVIESPNYPSNYPVNLNCLWIINVPRGNRINITFTHFDIYKPYVHYRRWWSSTRRAIECDRDYLQLKESNSDPDIPKRLCGSLLPNPASTNSNSMQIKFVTSYYGAHSGFRLEWISYGCGGHVQKRYGSLDKTLTSSEQLECEWLIETPGGTSIFLTFTKIYMISTLNCTTDAIEVYNGPNIRSPLLSKICHEGSVTLQSSTNFLLVRLIKTSSLKDVHFISQFASVQSTCGGLINSHSGVIVSTNFPKNYDNNLDCTWTITVPQYHRIEIHFTTLDLYSDSMYNSEITSCDDSIRLYDDVNILTTNYTHIICPHSNLRHFISKSNTMLLQFVSDSRGTAKGFKAIFNMTCGAVITAETEGIITNNKFTSYSNLNCTWIILAPQPDQKISLTITHLSLHSNNSTGNKRCPSSFLIVLDGNDENAPLIDEYCGSRVPPMIVSHGSAITIILGTNEDKIIGDFTAHYTATTTACGGTLTSEDGAVASPNYPLPYPVDIDCEWTLNTSPGNRVYVIFETFDLEASEECNEDYLEIRERSGSGQLLGVYCGNVIPSNTTIASELYIKFHSDNKTPGKGFFIRYGFLIGSDITELQKGEVASPLFPFPYNKPGEFSWRITSGNQILTLDVDKLVIHTHGDTCSDNLSFFDGLTDEAPLLKQLCGVLNDKTEVIQTSSNAVYIKLTIHESNSGALFHLRWARGDRIIDTDDENIINCGTNITEVILPGQSVIVHSPNYPHDYDDNLNCEWIYKATVGRHLSLHFVDLNIEETISCFADAISIYSSNAPTQWKPAKENICLQEHVTQDIKTSTYLKINFHTDSSITKKGFQGIVKSECGGDITDLSGNIGPTDSDFANVFGRTMRCDWKVKVRPGRLIKLQFESFDIKNQENDCKRYVILRNGDSVEAPLLGNAKYCGYSHEDRNKEVITSSNNLFVTYVGDNMHLPSEKPNIFKLRYEEQSINCGTTSKLDTGHSWEIITSPNYPSVPDPYSECNWVFTGPPGEILRVDFIDRFDLDSKEDCSTEFIEIHDGASDVSPLIGKYCRDNPGSVKSSSNSIFIKYMTQLLEPNNGFKANVSINVCGGTIRASDGEVSSPSYPTLNLPTGTVCEWIVIGSEMHTLMLKPQDIDLPESESLCDTKVTIEEFLPVNNSFLIIKTFCSEDYSDNSVIVTSGNKISIKLHLGKPSSYTTMSQSRGFRFTYNSSIVSCGGRINAPEGYLTTPGYPRETSIQYCHWRITVPNESRRITLEILDAGIEKHRIGIYNDLSFESSIIYFSKYDGSLGNATFESSGNKLALFIGNSLFRNSYHRFKARFSSSEPSLCGGSLSGTTGELNSPSLDQSYACEWHYELNSDIVTNSSIYKTIYITGNVNSSATMSRCRYSDPKLYISGNANQLSYQEKVCKGQVSYRLPSLNIYFKAIKDSQSFLNFRLLWKLQPCGGTVHVGEDPVNILKIPNTYNDSVDCVWVIVVPTGNKAEIKLEGSFELDCANEFIAVKRTLGFRNQMISIGDYCKDKPQDNPIILPYRNIYIEYHSNVKNNTKIKLIAKTAINECGGILSTFDTTFASPNYPRSYSSNLECVWELRANLGFRVSLQFINRFVIEKKPNCTKDAVIIYDWGDETFTEIARLCGRELPPTYNSTSNRMKIILRTDSDTNLDGFQAHWMQICGGTFNATSVEQYLYSPGYPSNYWPSMTCTYKISAGDQKIFLRFLEFELEGPYPSCENDNLTISSKYEYAEYCGKEIPPISHTYKNIEITFKSDIFLQKKGFKIAFSTYNCGGLIKEPKLISHGPLETYDEDMNCTWLIEAPKNKVVVIKFLYIDLEYSYTCTNDYIAAFEGSVIDIDKRLALICGHDNSTTVLRSRSNTMTVEFITDSNNYHHYKGFKSEVFFSYSESVGCGGKINMSSLSSYVLKSPYINSQIVYENYLDCHWSIIAPTDYVIKVTFSSFHIAPCENLNQTAVGYSKCDCDLVEIRDGINPDSLIIGTYCGHTAPPELVTSKNFMSIRLSTDGEIPSKGFEATLTSQPSLCGPSVFTVTRTTRRLKSPGYDTGSIARGLHCVYNFEAEYNMIHITVTNLDIQPGTTATKCDKDRLIITSLTASRNTTIGKDYVMEKDSNTFLHYMTQLSNFYDLNSPQQIVLCGTKKFFDIYVTGTATINLQTSPDQTSKIYKGMEIEVAFTGFCGRNYTESYGRIKNSYENMESQSGDCYTLITAPENYTISVYFLTTMPDYWNSNVYLDIYDGNEVTSKKLVSIKTEYIDNNPVFSSGRYILLHNHYIGVNQVTYDLNYIISDKGQGCGGYLYNEQGVVTSPFYPDIYRHKKTCEWELETPHSTHLYLHFSVFDLGRDCDNNYLQLVDRSGAVLSNYCSEMPADYTSADNYIKIVFITTMNNGGTGWVAAFVGIIGM